ncbi:MAG: DUF1525 domain-containing protein [Gammaproteobacteria bacterium]|nr:DUF1525 domain-containing protein [Gammaproteobacteria bacterium]
MVKKIITLILLFLAIPCYGHTFEIFTAHDITNNVVDKSPLIGNKIQVYYLDDMQRMQDLLNQHIKAIYLAAGEDAATQEAKAEIARNSKQYKQAAQGLIKAQKYNIRKIPAVIIDGKYQVLGTTNINQAFNSYEHYLLITGISS